MKPRIGPEEPLELTDKAVEMAEKVAEMTDAEAMEMLKAEGEAAGIRVGEELLLKLVRFLRNIKGLEAGTRMQAVEFVRLADRKETVH